MDKQALMFGLAQEWESSGLSKRAFCRRHGVVPSNFSYWFKKWKNTKQDDPDGFLALTPIKADNYSAQYRLTYPNGVQLEVSGVDIGQLSVLINL